MGEIESKNDWSFVILCISIGVVIGGLLAVPAAAYFMRGYSSTFEVNAQIGDFVGGILNPVIALLALMWLRKGVSLQERELKDTKNSLKISAEAQEKQVQISAVTALLQVELRQAEDIDTKLKKIYDEIDRLSQIIYGQPQSLMMSAITNNPSPSEIERDRWQSRASSLKNELTRLNMRQKFYAEKLRELAPDFIGLPIEAP